jgi:hypothetical protein
VTTHSSWPVMPFFDNALPLPVQVAIPQATPVNGVAAQ